jgi:hypothetical protein
MLSVIRTEIAHAGTNRTDEIFHELIRAGDIPTLVEQLLGCLSQKVRPLNAAYGCKPLESLGNRFRQSERHLRIRS